MIPTYAIDFETYYDKEVSITVQGVWHYLRHPQCDIYMVAIVGPGVEYVGRPEDAPWEKINGARWVAHNYAFDGAVVDRLYELGVIPRDVKPFDWNCTANLSVYHSAPRNLLGAARELVKLSLDKGMRHWMKGRSWDEAVAEGKADALREYALQDARACLLIWEMWSREWPAFEQWLSRHTIMMGWRGVATDVELLETSINHLQKIKWKAANALPFYVPGAKGISLVKFHQACRDAGIEPPATTAEDDPRSSEWEAKHADITWVREMRNWKKANTVLQKLLKLRDRTRPDGTAAFGLKYGGAHTLRWSGDGGFNMQNHERNPLRWSNLLGTFVTDKEPADIIIDTRSHLIPRKGKKFGIVDLSQIEPRVLAWRAKDWEFLKLVETMSPYEAHARLFMGWVEGSLKKKNPQLYSLAKARVLALGYGAGWEKFIFMCRTYGITPEEIFDVPYSNRDEDAFIVALQRNKKKLHLVDEFSDLDSLTKRVWVNAWLQVMDYRNKNTKVLQLWETLETGMRQAAVTDHRYQLVLPSGRTLDYFDVTTDGGLQARTERGGDLEHYYGGKLAENDTQASARDVFAEGVRRIETNNIPVVFHIHDEAVTEVDDEDGLNQVIAHMSVTPDWLKGCPVAAEGHLADFYMK